MPPPDCERLDAYLDGELDAAARSRFEEHLAACDSCRQMVALDRRIGATLAAAQPVAPRGLKERIDRRLRRAQFHRAAQRSALLAAAAALIAVGFWASQRREQGESPIQPPVAVTAKPAVRIRFADEDSVIAMPLKSKNPRVTIVWVYPAVRAAGSDAVTPEIPEVP